MGGEDNTDSQYSTDVKENVGDMLLIVTFDPENFFLHMNAYRNFIFFTLINYYYYTKNSEKHTHTHQKKF